MHRLGWIESAIILFRIIYVSSILRVDDDQACVMFTQSMDYSRLLGSSCWSSGMVNRCGISWLVWIIDSIDLWVYSFYKLVVCLYSSVAEHFIRNEKVLSSILSAGSETQGACKHVCTC
jgi:hypothetical protein